MKYLFSVTLVFISMNFSAQNPICVGQTFTIESKILDENREISIQLPKYYNDSKFTKSSYPVLYVLDGDGNFPFISALERFNTKFIHRSQPEMIIVGIKNIDRKRDFTPTKAPKYKTSGGAENFTKFIEKELKPYINKNFRTNELTILWGHSLSGLFVLNTMLKHPNLFKSYVAIDPSLWWDDAIMVKELQQKIKKVQLNKKDLFIASSVILKKDKKKQIHINSINSFVILLEENQKENFRYKHLNYPNSDHGEVPIPSTLDAIKFLFKGIKFPVKKIIKDSDIIRKSYEVLSKNINFEITPDESLLIQLIKFSSKIKNIKITQELVRYGLELYPDSKKLQELKLDE